jgi:hypothetical protein
LHETALIIQFARGAHVYASGVRGAWDFPIHRYLLARAADNFGNGDPGQSDSKEKIQKLHEKIGELMVPNRFFG